MNWWILETSFIRLGLIPVFSLTRIQMGPIYCPIHSPILWIKSIILIIYLMIGWMMIVCATLLNNIARILVCVVGMIQEHSAIFGGRVLFLVICYLLMCRRNRIVAKPSSFNCMVIIVILSCMILLNFCRSTSFWGLLVREFSIICSAIRSMRKLKVWTFKKRVLTESTKG